MSSLEEQYWEQRYSSGGTSGKGSIGDDRAYRWRAIDKYIPYLRSVLDVGCGDLSFWEERDCKDYTGIDISKTIIERNRILRPDWEFICANAATRIEGLTKEVVFCFDIIYHIMDEKTYLNTLKNLCHYSTDYIFINTWINNPFSFKQKVKKLLIAISGVKVRKAISSLKRIFNNNKITDGKYQYYRLVENVIRIFKKNGFQLLSIEETPDENVATYVFARDRDIIPDVKELNISSREQTRAPEFPLVHRAREKTQKTNE